jgi:hypothetical protein
LLTINNALVALAALSLSKNALSVVLLHPVLALIHVSLMVGHCVKAVEFGVASVLQVLYKDKIIDCVYLRETAVVPELRWLGGQMGSLAYLLGRCLVDDLAVLLDQVYSRYEG